MPSKSRVAGFRRAPVVVCVLCFMAVTGCGGGSDAGSDTAATAPEATASVDKYVGSWTAGCEILMPAGAPNADSPGHAEIEFADIVKVNDTEFALTGLENNYDNTDCSGEVSSVTNYSMTAKWVGTKVIGSEVVDKILHTEEGVTEKAILVRRGDRIYSGGSNTAVDAEGFPTAIDETRYVERR